MVELRRAANRVKETSRSDLPLLSMSAAHGVRLRDESDGRAASEDRSSYLAVKTGDIVVNKLSARDGAFGRSSLEGIVSPAYWVLSATAEFDSRYIDYFLHSSPALNEIGRLSKFMPPAQYDIAWEDFGRMLVPKLPLEEQRRIADFLDDQVQRMEAIRLVRDSQTAVFEEYFDSRLDESISSERLIPLKWLIDRTRPINYGVLMPGADFPGGVPLVEAGSLSKKIDVASLRQTSPEIEADFIRSRLLSGDLVMAIRGSIGAVQLVPNLEGLANVSRDAARISPNHAAINSRYLRYVLMSPKAQGWLRERALGSAVSGINIADLRQVPVPYLSLDEQASVAQRVDELEQWKDDIQSAVLTSLSSLASLRQSLITAAVTGDLDVTTARREVWV